MTLNEINSLISILEKNEYFKKMLDSNDIELEKIYEIATKYDESYFKNINNVDGIGKEKVSCDNNQKLEKLVMDFYISLDIPRDILNQVRQNIRVDENQTRAKFSNGVIHLGLNDGTFDYVKTVIHEVAHSIKYYSQNKVSTDGLIAEVESKEIEEIFYKYLIEKDIKIIKDSNNNLRSLTQDDVVKQRLYEIEHEKIFIRRALEEYQLINVLRENMSNHGSYQFTQETFDRVMHIYGPEKINRIKFLKDNYLSDDPLFTYKDGYDVHNGRHLSNEFRFVYARLLTEYLDNTPYQDNFREYLLSSDIKTTDDLMSYFKINSLYDLVLSQTNKYNFMKNNIGNSAKEETMLMHLDAALNSDFTINMLKRNWNKYHDIQYIGNLIGEIYTLHIVNKDGFGFEYYMSQMENLYSQYKAKKISPDNFNLQKSKLIAIIIAKKIGIDVSKQVTEEDMLKVKNYFLQEYVENGYVTHSFPDAYTNSVMTDGLISTTLKRKDKLNEIQEIQDIFMSKGVVAPLGGYPYYEGSGIYFEHDFAKTFCHSVYSPEWFAWFTSSDHTSAYQSNVNVSPYILRDEKYCRRNVEDLCQNADLTPEETKKVVDFYTLTYDKYSSSKLNVALIPKKVLGKSDASKVAPLDMDLLSTITFVLKDGAKQYVEHQGNVWYETISADKFKVSVIPSPSKYMYAEQYLKETKEHLTDYQSNLRILATAENNKNRMSPTLQEKVAIAKKIIENKQSEMKAPTDTNLENSNSQEKNSDNNDKTKFAISVKKESVAKSASFTKRSESEIQIATQINEKNTTIRMQNRQQKSLDKLKVKKLTIPLNNAVNSSSGGFVDTLIITLIIGFFVGIIFTIVYSILK